MLCTLLLMTPCNYMHDALPNVGCKLKQQQTLYTLKTVLASRTRRMDDVAGPIMWVVL